MYICPIGVYGEFDVGVCDDVATARRLNIEHRWYESVVVREDCGVHKMLVGSLSCLAFFDAFEVLGTELLFAHTLGGKRCVELLVGIARNNQRNK